MKSQKTLSWLLASCLAIPLLCLSKASQAQLEVGVMGIYQNGKEVGRIYVPPRHAKDDTYAEHWVLYPDYLYPSKYRPGLETVLVPMGESFSSREDFDKSFVAEPGSKIVDVLAHESKLK
ncbi:conserved exported hypothetical protein [Candidatus Nitrotoga sp. BS]|uniref:hypothetical protein n=1 Tax=Candidatus Nitrotoga sp. BS TaxID=2890408 RepID=UPI001EF1895F|nr:hypothetical protein [Candidatus Nitrotoga sp. BS]CAH1196992.1 conserved exported hypothetical protein [Candidatus Nitrotoga sp. BS]